jgi:adenylate kinase family enzyme
MKEGKLVPVKLTMELMEKAMKQVGNDTPGYLLDGFPRKVNQAKEFKKLVRAPSLVLFLHAPKQVLIHRLMQ